ncbi:MAG: hypothetical protein HOB40_11005 [Candidatus Marinimicrobia bacterium]|nr:hypothetical protein [Candidatus Neomarinimicrobiota bacterium]MBT3502558.1 hypothetical protein [Candidatus Neomarinimicrobiota bacterium]MBT3839595.1 hypothetical protein [Candidatus Neomarinimicrobiota bacterium]MBT3999122.1 hypothetical protein [Candidatus Neomarinimicrobiota bacterium]MBT4282303.1 hypothetical protein [Candidatus Neomarinimicrobiota bacterium]
MISILVLVFAMILLGEQIKLKKDVRRLEKLMKHLKNKIKKLNDDGNQLD